MATTTITPVEMAAWRAFLRARCTVFDQLDAELTARHGLTLSDYDVLVQLEGAEDRSLRMSDVARQVLLTRSGITRLVDGLVRDGLVERTACASDRRVSYARLTDVGAERLLEARATHHDGIRRAFAQHFSEAEIATLADLLGRIAGDMSVGTSSDCCD